MKRMSGSGKFEVIPIDEEIRNGSQEEDDNATERDPLRIATSSEAKNNMFLFSEEHEERPTVSKMLTKLADMNSVPPTTEGDGPPVKKGADLGTLTGVFLPCIQNIFGVILFIRMVWIVGTAGVPLAFIVVLICCLVTFATSISLSAIATNGIVPAGGSYFMISRALGPEFGGAVGILFFLATGVAGAMYITGAVEIVLNYMAPELALFGDFRADPNILYHNIRVYGTCLVVVCGTMVFIGVKFVSKVAPIALVCVILSILSIYSGIFINYEGTDASFCMLGDRIMASPVEHCTKNQSDPKSLYNVFCTPVGTNTNNNPNVPNININNGSLANFLINSHQRQQQHHVNPYQSSSSSLSYMSPDASISSYEATSSLLNSAIRYECDPFFMANEPTIKKAVPGLASGVLSENMSPKFRKKGDIVSYDDGEYDPSQPKYANIFVDITTSFTMFVAIYFPSCTGIMAGSNRSGDLKDGQKSIPLGTLGAQLTTSFVYLSSVILFGAAFNNVFIRDKFGECVGGQLAITLIAWPYPFLIVVGSLLSTLGAALQSLTSAPRLLQAIAADGIIPFLNPLAVIDSRGEPVRALAVTLTITEIAVIIGNLDFIAPILTMFFLMCYMFVNLACTLQSLLRTPSWRPRFKFYHWSFSLLGVILCLFVMFISSWYYALMAMFIAGCIYKYIEYRGAEKEWGDGIRGLALSAARYSLLRLEEGPPHTKNWRPQILVFVSLNQSNLDAQHDRKILTFASQLKAGKGLTLVGSILEGEFKSRSHEVQTAKGNLRKQMANEKVKGFADVLVSPSISDGLSYFVQISGLGGLKPNTVILGWPRGWKSHRNGVKKTKMFLDTVRNVSATKSHALLIPKGYESWPDSGDKMGGTIDIWWIVLDGGLLMLIPFLLKQHRTWRNAKLRIFTVAQLDDNSIQMKKDLATWVYALRIPAEVEVVEMHDTDITTYTYERTVRMEQRSPAPDSEPAYSRGRRESKTALAIEELLKGTKGIDKAREALESASSGEQKKSSGGGVRFLRKSSKDSGASGASDVLSEPGLSTSPPKASIATIDINKTRIGGTSGGGSDQLPVTVVAVQEATPESSPIRESAQQRTGLGKPPAPPPSSTTTTSAQKIGSNLLGVKPDESNVRRMHTAVKLNEAIVSKSSTSKLVILNLPGLPKNQAPDTEHHYMEFLEALTEGLERVLLVRGGGREVITIYS